MRNLWLLNCTITSTDTNILPCVSSTEIPASAMYCQKPGIVGTTPIIPRMVQSPPSPFRTHRSMVGYPAFSILPPMETTWYFRVILLNWGYMLFPTGIGAQKWPNMVSASATPVSEVGLMLKKEYMAVMDSEVVTAVAKSSKATKLMAQNSIMAIARIM